jgi:hypothetical protein
MRHRDHDHGARRVHARPDGSRQRRGIVAVSGGDRHGAVPGHRGNEHGVEDFLGAARVFLPNRCHPQHRHAQAS